MKIMRLVLMTAGLSMTMTTAIAAQPLPRDTVRVEMARLAWMDECSPVDDYVLDSQAALDSLRRYPQCAYLPARMDFARRVRVGVDVSADCNARTALVAHQSDSLRVLRVTLVHRYGGCRAMRTGYRWVEVPRPPAGYRVEVGTWDRSERGDEYRQAHDPVMDALDREAAGGSVRHPFGVVREVEPGVVAVSFEVVDLGGCRVVGSMVLDSPEALARLRRNPSCAHLPARMDFGEHVYVGVSQFIDCHARVALGAWRDDARRRVTVTAEPSGSNRCRAMRMYYQWIRLPRPPAGYTIGEGALPWVDPAGEHVGVAMAPRREEMDGCEPKDGFVLGDRETLELLRAAPGCAEVPDEVVEHDRALVHVVMHGSCGASTTELAARRFDAERVVRVYAAWVDHMCRAIHLDRRWVAIDRPPPGYRVELVHARVERGDT